MRWIGWTRFLARPFVTKLIPCYTYHNLNLSEPASLKLVHGLLVEIAGIPDIEGVVGNTRAPQLWKGEPDGLAGVLRWELPVFVYRSFG